MKSARRRASSTCNKLLFRPTPQLHHHALNTEHISDRRLLLLQYDLCITSNVSNIILPTESITRATSCSVESQFKLRCSMFVSSRYIKKWKSNTHFHLTDIGKKIISCFKRNNGLNSNIKKSIK